jgi:hypothetical protein
MQQGTQDPQNLPAQNSPDDEQPGIGIEAVDIALRLTDYCLGAAQSEGLDQICSTGFAGGFAIAM